MKYWWELLGLRLDSVGGTRGASPTGRVGWLAVILLDLGTHETMEIMILFKIFVGNDCMDVT